MNTRAIAIAVAILVIGGASAFAQGLNLQTGDGLTLGMSATGTVKSVQIGDTRLPFTGEGGFSVADFRNQPEPENIVPNPGFEQGAEGWRLLPTQHLDEAVFHSGKSSARIEVPGPDAASSSLGCEVPVKPNTQYRCELWIRRENVGVCGAYVSERGDDGKLTGKQTQVGRPIPKVDGVWHKLVWELTTQPETARLNFRADIYRSTGKLWLDDFSIAEAGNTVYVPVIGKLEKRGDGLTFQGSVPNAGLRLEATMESDASAIRVNGVVLDTTGEDRAVAVRFGLPVDAEGWTWCTELEDRETVAANGVHRYTYNCRTGIGECSVYPWSALSGPNAGLTLALPLSQGPRVFIIQHDQRAPQTSLTFYFGLARDAANNPSRAPFSFVIYRHDPAWGMRSAMERYYRLYPQSFVKRPQYEGYLNYARLEQLDPATHEFVAYQRTRLPDVSDFGEGYKFIWHLHGCYDFRMVPYDNPERPSDDTVMSLLNEMVEQEKEKPKYYTPTADTIKKLTYGPDGEILYIGDTRYWRPQEGYNHTDKPGWGLNFRVNEDPGVSDFLANLSRQKLEEYAKDATRRPWDACFTADAIEGYFANMYGPNFRREHFATTEVPLGFGKESLKPAMINTIWDFEKKCWWPLTEQYQVVTYGNANHYEQAFTMPFVDIPMIENEWDLDHKDRFERYLRAIAHHKIWRFWRVQGDGEKDEGSVRWHLARGLGYAVYPCVGALQSSGGDLEQYRHLFRQYVPAIEELSIAGWEPVPYARVSDGAVIERYGSYADGELHFTLRNYDEEAAKAVRVAIDSRSLGMPGAVELVAVDILPGLPTATPIDSRDWEVTVPANGSRAFWVGTREQMAQHGFRLAERVLGKIDRLFASELTEESRAQLQRAMELARRGAGTTGNDALAAANELQQLAGALETSIQTKAPVDLAKLVYRMRTAISYVPAGVLNISTDVPRVVENGLRGAAVPVQFALAYDPRAGISDINAQVRTPWEDVTASCTVAPALKTAQAGPGMSFMARLTVPADPPRLLMPYLVEITGKSGATPFTVALPVDVKVSAPLTVSVLPQRVFRGEQTKVVVSVTSLLQEAAAVRLKLSPPDKVAFEPDELSLELGPKATQTCLMTVSADENARLGELYGSYEGNSEDARLRTRGTIVLRVSDPVPTVEIGRVQTVPNIDGRLDDAAWQGKPTIPELLTLRGAKQPTESTAVWMAYDDGGLYVALKCAESQMDKLKANLTDRGAPLYQDDDVETFILLPGAPRALQFAINPLGTISDNFGNKTGWRAAAQRLEAAWTVEVSIPYDVIGVAGPPQPGTSWAFQFGRQQKAKGETTSWTPAAGFNVPEAFGEAVFE